MPSQDIKISHVSDTALWVAYYRAKETERPDALFKDPLAKILIGERGKKIAENMKTVGRYTEWAVISRTVMIDGFIQKKISSGIDLVINMGAGLDTRPYRMDLPNQLKWIEVDYPDIINLKNELLASEMPKCQLTRVILDLGNDEERKQFLAEVGSQSKNILVLTEGVIPYLSEEQVGALASDLHLQASIKYWITEFFSSEVYRYLKRGLRTKKMKNAPFKFFPDNWLGFFEKRGWIAQEIRYSGDVAAENHRKIPMPWFAVIFKIFASKKLIEKSGRISGYIVLNRK